jgi:hypothetical protein
MMLLSAVLTLLLLPALVTLLRGWLFPRRKPCESTPTDS